MSIKSNMHPIVAEKVAEKVTKKTQVKTPEFETPEPVPLSRPGDSAGLNYLPQQYQETNSLVINHNYLDQQFADFPQILEKIGELVKRGDFTLGEAVDVFEDKFAGTVGANYAVGVGSGTDALFLSLKALGIGIGDEVITTPFTFYATIGAIVTAGATPVFVDVGPDYNIDCSLLEKAITPKTKAILPVHWSGRPCDMPAIRKFADAYQLKIVQDACHGIHARCANKDLVSYGDVACYSMHPLKNLNVWGDAGVVTTQNESIAHELGLLRNHGLVDRDTCQVFAYNSRLDTLQAIVANHLLDNRLDNITASRIEHANYFDKALANVSGITLVERNSADQEVFHLYQINCESRDELQAFLLSKGIDAKVHYPVPMHLQPAASYLNHGVGDFPVCERLAQTTLSLPVHEYISREQQDFVVEQICTFCR